MKKAILTIVIVVIVAGAAWFLLSPLFINKEVDEEFPFSNMTESEREEMAESFEDMGITLPSLEDMKSMTKEEVEELEKEVVEKSLDMPDVPISDEMDKEGEPAVILSGTFKDADSFHMGSGEVSIYELSEGGNLMRFENFRVTNGPDLRVLLSKSPDPKDSGDLGDYVEIGKLKGNVGSQNYDIPGDIDIRDYGSVVIYCKPFHVVFSVASLK